MLLLALLHAWGVRRAFGAHRGVGQLEGPTGVRRLDFEVWGLGFEVWHLGFEVLGLGFEVSGLGFDVCRLGFEDWTLKVGWIWRPSP